MPKKRKSSTNPRSKSKRKLKRGNLSSFDDITVLGDKLFHTDATDVDRLEKKLRATFPSGYREFMSRFGEGTLSTFIRVYPPHQVLNGALSVVEWRSRIKEYWFWDAGKSVLTKSRALKCILVADTLQGDEVIFHPSTPDRLFVLPRYEESIYMIEGGLLPVLQWLLGSGTLTEPIEGYDFEPFDGTAPPPEAVATPVRSAAPEDLISLEPIHEQDGSVICRIYRFGSEHQRLSWDGRSPLSIDVPTLIANAVGAADEQWGKRARIKDLRLYTDPPHVVVKTEPVDGLWDETRLYCDTTYLDLAGAVIAPVEHVFTTSRAYQEFADQLYGR